MAQFDVFRNATSRTYPLVLDLQANLLGDLATRVVAPMTPLRGFRPKPMTRINPVVSVAGRDYVVLFQEMAAIPAARLGPAVASLSGRRVDLVAALDLLFTGI